MGDVPELTEKEATRAEEMRVWVAETFTSAVTGQKQGDLRRAVLLVISLVALVLAASPSVSLGAQLVGVIAWVLLIATETR